MPIVINVSNSGLGTRTHAGITVSDCVHYTSVKRREWNCFYERRSVTALYSRSFVQPQVSSGGEVSILKGPDYALAYGRCHWGEGRKAQAPERR